MENEQSKVEIPKPTPGRVVLYRLASYDIPTDRSQLNGMGEGDVLPATVVRVFEGNTQGCCNLKVKTDGPGPDLWKTSVLPGDGPGQWSWPPRV